MIAEPIAVVGMACRLPGASDPDAYWTLLREGRSAITEVPPSRWDADALYAAAPRSPGKMHTRWGAFLDDVYGFDAPFFKVMPIEAPRIDPQQRLVLEVAWEALEHAAIDPTSLAGSLTGVYVGVSHSDHDRLLYADRARIDGYNGPDTYHCFVANRLSYFLRLRGPSLAVDGACSSSLAAVHLACQALRTGDCDLALAGGVNLNLTPDEFIALSFLGVLSPGEQGRPFAAAADGYVRGEGCGVLVLKRLADAEAACDNILAVVRGSALNHNGLSNGITAPSGLAQEEAIRRALAGAGIDPGEVTHIEAMGTGTALGDPMEIDALAAVYGAGEAPCWVTSVKANIGHLEAASGAASLIKVILSLQQETIPPQVNLDVVNPRIHLDGTRLDFPRVCQAWPASAGRRLAAVSAFGFGGANAHLLLEGSPSPSSRPAGDSWAHLFTLSAQTGPALLDLARRYVVYLDGHPDADVATVCYTTNTGRAHWRHRLAVVASTREELCEGLAAFIEDRGAPGLFRPAVPQGSWPGEDPRPSLLDGMAAGYVAGESIRWPDLHGDAPRRRVVLPTYPFQRVEHRLPDPGL